MTNEKEDAAKSLDERRDELRHSVRMFYDMQKLRIQAKNRGGSATAELSEKHKQTAYLQGWLLEKLEAETLSEVKRLIKTFPIYDWLDKQKGCGPTMSGVLLSEIDIHRANTASSLWAYCGLAVKDGEGQRRKKGEKLNYNPFLKTKMVGVLSDCMIKSKSPWTEYYYNYKTRKENTKVPKCMRCGGNGVYNNAPCYNCDGSGKNAPWGKSQKHRDQAARRYMIKMFLMEFWKEWRTLEGLPTPDPYAEAYLGRTHGDHGGIVTSQVMQ